MAIQYMNEVKIPHYKNLNDTMGYESEDELAAPGNGPSIIIPDSVNNISLTLGVTGGSGKVQASTDSWEDIKNEVAGVEWFDWPDDVVTVTTEVGVEPVAAIRQVNVSGTTKLTVRAQ